MSLSDHRVIDYLNKNFVCGWRNIKGTTEYAGKSHDHAPTNPAVTTTNGAGSSNVQFVIMSPDHKVLHCLPGYWSPEALVHELRFARTLFRILSDPRTKDSQKNDEFLLAHLNHAAKHSHAMKARSKLQHFDEAREKRRDGGTDFTREACDDLKTVDQVVHERMAERPFLDLADFDVATFVDIGTKFYDAHRDCKHTKKIPNAGAAARRR